MIEKARNNALYRFIREYNIIIILLFVLIAAVLTASPRFTKITNLYNLSQSIGTYGILAMGLTFVFIAGAIDLSIGYQVALDGTLLVIMANNFGLLPAIAVTLVIGAAIGYLNGTVVTRLKITPLIATLAVMTILKGAVLALNKDNGNIQIKDATLFGMGLTQVYNMEIFGFLAPSLLIAIIMLAVFAVFLSKTRPGINLYVTGGNREAGILAGIKTDSMIRLAYSVSGFCAAVCAILLVFRLSTATYNMGDNIDITAICAVVVGGIKMSGGKGNMAMCIMGVAVMQIINNVMTKLGLHPSVQSLVTGIVVIAVLIADKYTRGKESHA